MSQITCDVVNLKKRLFRNKDCNLIVVPGKAGEMGFMEGHVPTLTKLTDGAIRAHLNDGTVVTIASQGGYAYCTGGLVYVLADRSAMADDIDIEKARIHRSHLEERLKNAEEGSIDQKVIARKIRWCDTCIKVKQEAGSSL